MLALLGAIEGFVARNGLDFSDPVSLSWRLSADSARQEAPGCGVLLIGDSLVKHGLVPRLVEGRTGLRAVNLGVARGPAPATYFLLRRALDAGARPAAVVVDYKPSVLIGGLRYNLRYWQEIASAREVLELARSTRNGTFLTSVVLGRLLPSYRARLELRANLREALRGEAPLLGRVNRVCARNWRVNAGANVASRNPAFHGEVGADEHKTLHSDLWYCDQVNVEYVRRLLALTAAYKIRVYWLLPPLSPQLQVRREETEAEAGYLSFVRSMQGGFPHLTILDGRHAGYGPEVFVDATHLDGQGARTLSLDVAAILRRDLSRDPSAPRWVDLPSYRDPPVEIALEDVEQSRAFLKIVR
jgi:hypothetical protein